MDQSQVAGANVVSDISHNPRSTHKQKASVFTGNHQKQVEHAISLKLIDRSIIIGMNGAKANQQCQYKHSYLWQSEDN